MTALTPSHLGDDLRTMLCSDANSRMVFIKLTILNTTNISQGDNLAVLLNNTEQN